MTDTGGSRYFTNEARPSRRAGVRDEFIASLTRINAFNPPVQTCSTGWGFHGLFKGPTSVAYLFLRLARSHPDVVFKGQSFSDWAQAYLDLGPTGKHGEIDPNHCGIANEVLAQLALRAAIEQDASLVQRLCSYAKVINTTDEQGSDEWLYGRSGYLYFLRLVRSALDPQEQFSANKLVEETIQKTVDRILASPRPWRWHGTAYLGAAHGSIGIVCQVVLSAPSRAGLLEETVAQLLDLQFPSGNFPSSLPPGSDELVQFCHGGPGFVLALTSIRPYFPALQARIDQAVEAARRDIWRRGLLTKVPCLCHGIAGNALALADEAEFEHFLACMTTDVLESQDWMADAGRSDKFVGLYGGEAGRAWVWSVADKKMEKTCLGFNDL